jgi:hypothetical protein
VAIALGAAGIAALSSVLLQDDGPSDDTIADLLVPRDPGPVHVHGLGVNPSDRALLVATHSGLWRSPPGESRSERVGESRQDTMGFTVAGPDYSSAPGIPIRRHASNKAYPHISV